MVSSLRQSLQRTFRLGIRPTALPSVLALLVLTSAAGCSRNQAEAPEVQTAGSVEAQEELRRLEEEWEIGSETQRRALRERLEEFVVRFKEDPSVARARVLLGKIALMEGRFGAAREVVQPVVEGPPGRQRDEAQLVVAGVQRRSGEPEAALQTLEPLEGKLLTSEARHQFSLERVLAGLDAGRWSLVVEALVAWVGESDQQRAEAERWSREAIRQIPIPELAKIFLAHADPELGPSPSEAEKWVYRVVIERLSTEALRSRDARLARDLLEHSPTWLRASEVGDELAMLAALANDEISVSGRTIGVVIGKGNAAERQRAVRITIGLMRGLRLGRGRLEQDVQLLVEEQREELDTSLAALAARGAAVLVAAVRPEDAESAVRFSTERKVPVVVFSAPQGSFASRAAVPPYAFSFSAGRFKEQQAIVELLPKNEASTPAFVGSDELPCPQRSPRPGLSALPLMTWQQEGRDAVVVLGSPRCARLVQREISATDWRPQLVLGLEAAVSQQLLDSPTSVLAAGRYPQAFEKRPSDQYDPNESKNSPAVVGYHEQMGIDLARLLIPTVSILPQDAVLDPEAVRTWHDRLRDRLLEVEAELVTTSSRGFQGRHSLTREFRLDSRSAEP